MASQSPSSFVATIDLKWSAPLLEELKRRDCEISTPPYTCFAAKKKGFSCTLYTSGKLVVQGKESAEFIEYYLEPEILKTFQFTHPLAGVDSTSHIGIDESGKGDFFGPLCIAGVFVEEKNFTRLHAIGVKDSKTLTDSSIRKIGKEIQKICLYHIVQINPLKYNQVYESFKNLNHLLAWGHATAIEKLVMESHCQDVIIDQFADERVVERALKRKNLKVNLTQRHKAEEDLAVAAASILARYAFIEGLDRLSETIGIPLPKGSSKATIAIGKEILRRWGKDKLKEVCKEHFKTLDSILGKERE